MYERGIKGVCVDACAPSEFCAVGSPVPERVEHPLERARSRGLGLGHQINLPTVKITTASSHAITSCIPTPKTAHRHPTSRFWAARVATHGV
jgi:hypothetical protein